MSLLDNTLQADARTEEETAVPPVPPTPAQSQQPAAEPPAETAPDTASGFSSVDDSVRAERERLAQERVEIERRKAEADRQRFDRRNIGVAMTAADAAAWAKPTEEEARIAADERKNAEAAKANEERAAANDEADRIHRRALAKSGAQDALAKMAERVEQYAGSGALFDKRYGIDGMSLDALRNYFASSAADDDSENGRDAFDWVSRAVLNKAGKLGLLPQVSEDGKGVEGDAVFYRPGYGVVFGAGDLDAERWTRGREDQIASLRSKIEFLSRRSENANDGVDEFAKRYGAKDKAELLEIVGRDAFRDRSDLGAQRAFWQAEREISEAYEREKQGRSIWEKGADAFSSGTVDLVLMGENIANYVGNFSSRHEQNGEFMRRHNLINAKQELVNARHPRSVASVGDIGSAKDFGAWIVESVANLAPQIGAQTAAAILTGGVANLARAGVAASTAGRFGASAAARAAVARAAGAVSTFGGSAALNFADVLSQRIDEGVARGEEGNFSDLDVLLLTAGYTAVDTISPTRKAISRLGAHAALSTGQRSASKALRDVLRGEVSESAKDWLYGAGVRKNLGRFFLGGAKEMAVEGGGEAFQQVLSYVDNYVRYGVPGHKSLGEDDWDLHKMWMNALDQGLAAMWSAGASHAVSHGVNYAKQGREVSKARAWHGAFNSSEALLKDVRDAGFDPDFLKLPSYEQVLVAQLFRNRAGAFEQDNAIRMYERALDKSYLPEGKAEAEFLKNLRGKMSEVEMRRRLGLWEQAREQTRKNTVAIHDYLQGEARAWVDAWMRRVPSLPAGGVPATVQPSLRTEALQAAADRALGVLDVGGVSPDATGGRTIVYGEDAVPGSSHRMMFEERTGADGHVTIEIWNAANLANPYGAKTTFELGEDGDTVDELRRNAGTAAAELTRFYDWAQQNGPDAMILRESQSILAGFGRAGQSVRAVGTEAEIVAACRAAGVSDADMASAVARLVKRGDAAVTAMGANGRPVVLVVRDKVRDRANLAATLAHETFHVDFMRFIERTMQDKEAFKKLRAEIDPENRLASFEENPSIYEDALRKCLSVAFLGLDVDKGGRKRDWTSVSDSELEEAEERIAVAAQTAGSYDATSSGKPHFWEPFRMSSYLRYKAGHPELDRQLGAFLARIGVGTDDRSVSTFIAAVHEAGSKAGEANDADLISYSPRTTEDVWRLVAGNEVEPPTRSELLQRKKEENDRLVREANERMAAEQQAEAEAIARYDAQQRESAGEKAEEAQRADEENDLRARAAAQDAGEKAEEQERQRRTERENAAVVARVKAKRAARREQMRRSLQERASRAKSDRVNKIYWRFEDFLDKYHPDVMDDEVWQKGNAEQLARLEKGLRENNPQIVLEATEALRKKLRGRPSPTTEARAREAAELEQAEADRREQEAIRRENEAEEAGLRALEEQEEAQRLDERAEGERAAKGAAEAEAAEHADNPLAVEAERREAEATRLEAVAKEKESKAKRGGKDKTAAEKARRLADRARKEAKAARAAQLGERTTSAYWANRPILDREDARDRRTARRRDEALQAEYDRLIAAGASEAQARRQANMAVTPARLNSRNVAGRPAVVAQNPGRFPIHEALEGRTLFGEVRPGDEAWEYVSDMTSREAREAGLADRLLPKERGSRGLDSVVEALAENSPVLAARYGEDGDSGVKAAELVDEFLAENREIDDLVSDGALSEQERHNEDEEIEANRRRLGFYDERYEGMDDPERLAHIRDEVEARLKGMAPALPAEVAEAAAQDKAALDAQEELEAESPEAVQARRDSEAERAQQRFQESLVAQREDEFFGDDYLAESAPRVRSRGGDTEAEGVAEPGIDVHLDAVQVPADRREEAKKAIQQELFSIDEMSKDGFLYPRSPEAEAAKPRKKISMRKPSPAPTVYTPEEKRRAFRALNSEEYAAENPADLALAKRMLDDGLTVSSVIGELYSGERFTWPVRGFRIAKPADVAALTQMLRSPYQESFKVVFTDARGTILDARVCSFGDIDACPVNPSTVLLDAPEGTVGVYVSHNHPSGDPRPSSQDVRITRSLGETCEMLGYELLDHVVTNGAKFHSMRDSGDAEFSEGRRMHPAGNLRPGERAVPEFKRDVKAWEAVPVDERWQNDRPEEAFALAGRFRALETGGAFIVTLDRKCKLTGVSKMTPDELARPDAGREMLRRVQRVKEACCWMIVVGDAGVDLDRFARRSSGGMDARIGKPLVDVFLRDESGRFYSTRRQGVLRFDEYSGFEGATYNEMRRLGLTRDTVERYVAEHPAPRMEAAEPASRVRSRGASDATLEAAKLDRATYEAFTDSEDAVFHSFVNPDGTMKPGWMKAPNGKKSHLSPRQFVQVRTQEFKAWFGDWEARYYSQGWKDKIDPGAILSLPAVDISGYAPLADKAAIAEAFEEFGEVANKNDGRKVRFPSNVAGRMVFHKRTAAAFKELFESSVRAWSENETHFEGHKAHSNIRAYHQYVNKFTDTEGEHFVRFTVREDNPGKGAQNNVHAAVVTNVELLENGSDSTLPDSSTGRSESPAQGISPRADKKLALFISDFKPENVSKVVDENGEPLIVAHSTDAEFTVFRDMQKNDAGWLGAGFYFFGDRSLDGQYGRNVMECFLNVREPYFISGEERDRLAEADDADASAEFSEEIRGEGYDGVYYNGDLNREWAVFSPSQIKSATDNAGTWDGTRGDVRSRGGVSLDDVYGVRTRDVVEQIKLRRHEYDYDPQKRHVCDMVEEAFSKAQADPAWFKSVVDRALAPVKPGDQPPAFNTQEQGALMLDMHLRAEASDVAATRLAALKAAGASVEEIAAANARYAELEAARFAMEEAYIRQGKALSDAMNQRKAAFDKSTGSFAGLMEAFEQATGRKPGASERARIRDAWREIERLRKALSDAIRDVGNRDFDAAMAAIMSLDLDDLLRRRRSGPGKPGKAGAKGEADRSAWPKTREELEALAKERVQDLELDRDDPDATRLLLRPFVRWVGKCLLNLDVEAGREMASPEAFRSALGVTCRAVLGEEFADWSDRTWGDIYSNYGNVTPASTDELKVRISQMTALQRLVSQLQDLENRMRPLKTGPQRVAMESQAEALRAEINAKMKELNLPIPEGADPSRFIKSPQEIQKEAMRKAIDRLERAIRDGVPFPKNADPIALDEEGQALRTLLEDLRKQYKEAFPLSDAEIVKRIVKAYEKAEERAQRELDAALAGDFRGAPAETREKLLRENDLRVQVMRERVAMLREARQELEDAAGPDAYYSEWSKAVRRAVQSKLNAAQRYHDWIANPSEFEKWQRKRQNKLDVGDDPAVKDAQKKLDDARQAWFKTLDDLAWADMNWLEKAWETAVGVSDVSKRFIASADLSSIGIQAAVAAILRDPSLGWRTAKDALWAKGGKGFAFSEEKCRELLEKMQNDPEWHTVVDLMGIRISDWHADSGDFGEEYRKAGIAARRGLGISKMLNDNKILRFGDRTYTMPLNLIRFAYAKQMIAHLTKMYGEAYLSTEQGRKDLKLLGRVVNMETGRGDWFTKNAAGSFVSKILWAPGKFAGQLQTMFLPVTLLLNDNRASARTRAMVFRQCWLRPLIGWAILVMFLRAIAHLLGDDDRRDEIGDFMETNPLNPMFGRVNLGGRRFSLSAGMESYISVASRVAMMKTASKYDEEKRLADPTGPIVNTLSNKFNPPVGIAWRLARRKDVDGTKLDNPGAVAYFLFKNLCMPITGTDFTKTALDLKPGEFLKREDAEARTGLLHKAVLLPLSFLGVSSNRYGWDAREADVANFDRLAKEFKALAKVYENKGGTYSANEIAKAREGILNLRGDAVLGLYAKEWTRGKELRDRLRQIENAIKAEGKEKKPDKERLAQLEQLRGETLTAFHRLYHPQFARDAR